MTTTGSSDVGATTGSSDVAADDVGTGECDAVTQLRRTANWVAGMRHSRLRSGDPSVADQCRRLVLETVALTRDLCRMHPEVRREFGAAAPCPPDDVEPAAVGEWALSDQLRVVAADLGQLLNLLPTADALADRLCALADECVALRRRC